MFYFCVPASLAYPGHSVVDKTKDVGMKTCDYTYKVVKYLAVELLRPVAAITHGLTNVFGVTVREEDSGLTRKKH